MKAKRKSDPKSSSPSGSKKAEVKSSRHMSDDAAPSSQNQEEQSQVTKYDSAGAGKKKREKSKRSPRQKKSHALEHKEASSGKKDNTNGKSNKRTTSIHTFHGRIQHTTKKSRSEAPRITLSAKTSEKPDVFKSSLQAIPFDKNMGNISILGALSPPHVSSGKSATITTDADTLSCNNATVSQESCSSFNTIDCQQLCTVRNIPMAVVKPQQIGKHSVLQDDGKHSKWEIEIKRPKGRPKAHSAKSTKNILAKFSSHANDDFLDKKTSKLLSANAFDVNPSSKANSTTSTKTKCTSRSKGSSAMSPTYPSSSATEHLQTNAQNDEKDAVDSSVSSQNKPKKGNVNTSSGSNKHRSLFSSFMESLDQNRPKMDLSDTTEDNTFLCSPMSSSKHQFGNGSISDFIMSGKFNQKKGNINSSTDKSMIVPSQEIKEETGILQMPPISIFEDMKRNKHKKSKHLKKKRKRKDVNPFFLVQVDDVIGRLEKLMLAQKQQKVGSMNPTFTPRIFKVNKGTKKLGCDNNDIFSSKSHTETELPINQVKKDIKFSKSKMSFKGKSSQTPKRKRSSNLGITDVQDEPCSEKTILNNKSDLSFNRTQDRSEKDTQLPLKKRHKNLEIQEPETKIDEIDLNSKSNANQSHTLTCDSSALSASDEQKSNIDEITSKKEDIATSDKNNTTKSKRSRAKSKATRAKSRGKTKSVDSVTVDIGIQANLLDQTAASSKTEQTVCLNDKDIEKDDTAVTISDSEAQKISEPQKASENRRQSPRKKYDSPPSVSPPVKKTRTSISSDEPKVSKDNVEKDGEILVAEATVGVKTRKKLNSSSELAKVGPASCSTPLLPEGGTSKGNVHSTTTHDLSIELEDICSKGAKQLYSNFSEHLTSPPTKLNTSDVNLNSKPRRRSSSKVAIPTPQRKAKVNTSIETISLDDSAEDLCKDMSDSDRSCVVVLERIDSPVKNLLKGNNSEVEEKEEDIPQSVNQSDINDMHKEEDNVSCKNDSSSLRVLPSTGDKGHKDEAGEETNDSSDVAESSCTVQENEQNDNVETLENDFVSSNVDTVTNAPANKPSTQKQTENNSQKRKRKYVNDMGYSKPKRRRKQKKTSAAQSKKLDKPSTNNDAHDNNENDSKNKDSLQSDNPNVELQNKPCEDAEMKMDKVHGKVQSKDSAHAPVVEVHCEEDIETAPIIVQSEESDIETIDEVDITEDTENETCDEIHMDTENDTCDEIPLDITEDTENETSDETPLDITEDDTSEELPHGTENDPSPADVEVIELPTISADMQLPKKKYQKAGLYSNTYKGDHVKVRKFEATRSSTYNPEEHEHGLFPAPIHVGKYMREKRQDFQLPYDIYFLHKNNLLHREKPSNGKFRKIKKNIYVDCKPTSKYDTHTCNCKPSYIEGVKGCQEYCLNKMIFTECDPSTCPSGHNCGNQRFQKYEWCEGLETFSTSERGVGVRTATDIHEGQFILEYVGEVVTESEFQRRMTSVYSNENHHYCLNLDSGLVIDGYRFGNLCRFVNHSCEPNCDMQKWNVGGLYRMGLFASRDIKAGEEIHYDYNFQTYNMDSQQECRCQSANCRGVIGGKPRNNKEQLDTNTHKKSSRKSKAEKLDSETSQILQTNIAVKPLSHRERCFAQKHGVFLLRNLEKVRNCQKKVSLGSASQSPHQCVYNKTEVFLAQFNALNTARSVKTRGLAMAQVDPELTRAAKLAQVFKIIYNAVSLTKDEEGNVLCTPLLQLPSRKKYHEYYEVIDNPIDMNTIEKNIVTGAYSTIASFHADFMRLFKNVEISSHLSFYSWSIQKNYNSKLDLGKLVQSLRKAYLQAKEEAQQQFEEILGEDQTEQQYKATHQGEVECVPLNDSEKPSEETELSNKNETDASESSNVEAANESIESTVIESTSENEMVEVQEDEEEEEEEEEEEVIRCVCNIYRDEGVMICCEKCNTWQHCDCIGVSSEAVGDDYACELCSPRELSKEIPLVPQPDDGDSGYTYYLTLLRGELQIKVGQCVYLSKDEHLVKSGKTMVRPIYTDVCKSPHSQMDIFQIERLWKNKEGEKFAWGHLFMRPIDIVYPPSRGFFSDEVIKSTITEVIPLDVIVNECCIMDYPAYCLGRPKGVPDCHIYVCEYRADKAARNFHKIKKPKFPVNTKNYCFNKFSEKRNPKRTQTLQRSVSQSDELPTAVADTVDVESQEPKIETVEIKDDSDSDDDVPLAKIKVSRVTLKKRNINFITSKLLERLSQREKQ